MNCQYPECEADAADEDIVCTEHRRVADEKRARAARLAYADRAARTAAARAEAAEPACWSWELPTRTEAEVRADLASRTGDQRLSPGTIDRILSNFPEFQFDEFHGGHCAICGCHGGGELVIDHDHATGLVRGMLCRGCNVAEGMSGAPIFRAYRERNPASILGLRSPYYVWSNSPAAQMERMDAESGPPHPFDQWRDNPMTGLL